MLKIFATFLFLVIIFAFIALDYANKLEQGAKQWKIYKIIK